MEQKRLITAIGISVAILVLFQLVMPHPQRPQPNATASLSDTATPTPNAHAPQPSDTLGATPSDAGTAPVPPPENAPRVQIFAPAVQGSISLMGARLDDLVLRDYRETIQPDSPLVRLLAPRRDPQPYYVQFGWTAAGGVKVPDPNTTLWTASAGELSPAKPVTLSWDNGNGQTFQIEFAIDDHYMFTVNQRVRNTSGTPVEVYPWSRIRRDYTPQVAGYYILHEGLLGVVDGTLKEMKYSTAKEEGAKKNGLAYSATTLDSWAGITDKYWLTSLIPDPAVKTTLAFRDTTTEVEGKPSAGYQVDYVTDAPQQVAGGAEAAETTHLFAGAKVVRLLDTYESEYKIPNFDKAVDFGWFYFLTKPFFFAIDWLNSILGNFGLAIMVFTLGIKELFFPLANKSYRSMSKMKLLAPKMQALKERYKDEPQKLQGEMMQLYKTEKVNPASGCLPMLIQIPVFFSLYKVIFVTIEMRHAPFFGWIRDLSAVDPTNVFNLFGLLPFDPTMISPWLHLGAWPLIMGFTMFFQQRLNPPPPDPMQARLFQFMPLIFTFMLARFPAGLVIYWSWNNTLTILQQWLIMRQTTLSRARVVRST
ncbi:MAG TPA: membrane protein insertase YidC [Acetobacteraceae bacterium]|nr:membrane protein insertase YidC [Acetobacteraceae bacterium]